MGAQLFGGNSGGNATFVHAHDCALACQLIGNYRIRWLFLEFVIRLRLIDRVDYREFMPQHVFFFNWMGDQFCNMGRDLERFDLQFS